MPVAAERRKQVIFGAAARLGIGLVHSLRELGAEERVVLDVDPQHGYARALSEFACRRDQFVGGAIGVGFAADASASARRRREDCPNRWQVLARQRERRPATGGVADQ